MSKPKIFCFVQGHIRGDVVVSAVAEDGHHLAAHASSSIDWAKHDIGLTSEWKHDSYREHYPDGYELEWVEDANPGKHAGLDAAYEKNRELANE